MMLLLISYTAERAFGLAVHSSPHSGVSSFGADIETDSVELHNEVRVIESLTADIGAISGTVHEQSA